VALQKVTSGECLKAKPEAKQKPFSSLLKKQKTMIYIELEITQQNEKKLDKEYI